MTNRLRLKISLFLILALMLQNVAYAEMKDIPLIVATQNNGVTSYNLSIKIIAAMTALTVLPALLMTTTAFTRIIIVMAILRQAVGIPNVPSNQILIGLSLILSLFVMMPVINKVNETSLQPYMENKINEEQAVTSALAQIKLFMLKQTHKKDLKLFYSLSKEKVAKDDDHPLLVVLPAYITSELKTAFEIGFLIFIPFLIIDLVVSSILMSIGMMMLSPMIISLPFKILFFVLVDGWGLVATSLVTSFRF
jgi:flagellar biosynthetic protein FliP